MHGQKKNARGWVEFLRIAALDHEMWNTIFSAIKYNVLKKQLQDEDKFSSHCSKDMEFEHAILFVSQFECLLDFFSVTMYTIFASSAKAYAVQVCCLRAIRLTFRLLFYVKQKHKSLGSSTVGIEIMQIKRKHVGNF